MKGMKNLVGIGLCLVVLFVAGSSSLLAAEMKFPSKPIIFVAPGTLGGGSDIQARLCQDAIDRKGILKEPVVVLNKGRGGAQEAYTFTAGKKGDPHYALTAANMFLTYPMVGAGYDPKDFTPIANLVFDPGVIVARSESPFKTLEDVVRAAKSKPDSITIGGGTIGTQDHMAYLTIANAAGIKLRFVPFPGGGIVHRNVLGGQTDLAIGNPSDFISSVEAGKLKALVTTAPSRSSGTPSLADVPTLKEKGYNVTFVTWRGWLAPAGISQDHIKALEGLFKIVSDDAEFQTKYVKANGMVSAFMSHDEFVRFLSEQGPVYEKLLRQAGVLK